MGSSESQQSLSLPSKLPITTGSSVFSDTFSFAKIFRLPVDKTRTKAVIKDNNFFIPPYLYIFIFCYRTFNNQ